MAPSPWTFHLAAGEVGVVAVLAGLGILAFRAGRPSRARVAAYAAGVLLAAAVLLTPVSTIALEYLLAAHLLQNVALAEWVPLLLLLGIAPPLAERLTASPLARWLSHPFVALPLWLVSYAVWHVPAVYDAALRTHALLALEHVSYLATGVLLWWPVVQDAPHRLSNAARAIYLFAAFLLASPLGLLLTFLPEPIYGFYEEAPRLWGLSPLADQQMAGVVMAGSEAIVFFAGFSFFLLRFLEDER
jgi:cytochrome c oxidase assembly factor CtaG